MWSQPEARSFFNKSKNSGCGSDLCVSPQRWTEQRQLRQTSSRSSGYTCKSDKNDLMHDFISKTILPVVVHQFSLCHNSLLVVPLQNQPHRNINMSSSTEHITQSTDLWLLTNTTELELIYCVLSDYLIWTDMQQLNNAHIFNHSSNSSYKY